MKPEDRENWRYSNGGGNPIEIEERIMFSLLPKLKGAKLLDVGCGIGTISCQLQKRGFEVYGIDFSSVAIKKAKEKGIKAMECDVDKNGIPFEDNYFDVVWAGDIIEHVFDPIFLLKEMSRVVKPLGKVLLTTPNNFHLKTRLSVFISGKSPQSDVYKNFGQYKHHTMFSLDLLEYMLDQAGLDSHSIHSIIKIPKSNIKRYCKIRILGALFGAVFIVETHNKRDYL